MWPMWPSCMSHAGCETWDGNGVIFRNARGGSFVLTWEYSNHPLGTTTSYSVWPHLYPESQNNQVKYKACKDLRLLSLSSLNALPPLVTYKLGFISFGGRYSLNTMPAIYQKAYENPLITKQECILDDGLFCLWLGERHLIRWGVTMSIGRHKSVALPKRKTVLFK